MEVALRSETARERARRPDPVRERLALNVAESDPRHSRAQLAALIERVGSRQDRNAFKALFQYFAPRIRAYYGKRGLAASHADDLTQEVMVSIWRRAQSYDAAKAAPSTWIYTIARNQQIDDFRKTKRAQQLDADDPHFHLNDMPTQDALVERSEDARSVVKALSNLPDDQRYVLSLAFQDGLSHREIADRLNLPLGTVKSRIRLAMDRMRVTIGEWK